MKLDPQVTENIPAGAIIFKTGAPDHVEVLRFEPDGRCFVRGELVETNQEIWVNFKRWAASATITGQGTFE